MGFFEVREEVTRRELMSVESDIYPTCPYSQTCAFHPGEGCRVSYAPNDFVAVTHTKDVIREPAIPADAPGMISEIVALVLFGPARVSVITHQTARPQVRHGSSLYDPSIWRIDQPPREIYA